MGVARRKRLPAGTHKLRERIDEWRRTREKRGPMPEELWAEAVALAEGAGPYCISRAVGVNYESLRARLERARPEAVVESEAGAVGFVEIPSALLKTDDVVRKTGSQTGRSPVNPASEPMTTVELCAADGARLTVRLLGCSRVDVVGLAESFWGRLA